MKRLDSLSLSALGRGFAVALAVSALTLAFAMGLGWRQAARLEADFESVVTRTEEKTAQLAALQGALGYGGLIHEFKNFVLRQDTPRIAQIRAHQREVDLALNAYSAQGLTPTERELVSDLSEVLREYATAVSAAERLSASGATTVEIDRSVRIDDGPALAAIAGLERELARSRTENSAQAREVVATLNTLARATFFGGAGFLLVATLCVFWFVERRIASPIANLVAKAERLSTGDLRSAPAPEA